MKINQKIVAKRISKLREQLEDLKDYLDLLEARARNKDKRTFTRNEVRKQLGIT